MVTVCMEVTFLAGEHSFNGSITIDINEWTVCYLLILPLLTPSSTVYKSTDTPKEGCDIE